MKVVVKEANHRPIVIYFPVWPGIIRFILRRMHRKNTFGNLTDRQINLLAAEFRKARKYFRKLVIVDVESSTGETVRISL